MNSYLGQYYLTEVIGRGSTSVVYKAYQSSLNRYVAVKVLLRNLDAQFASRFIREAHAVAQLQHPNILPIYDYGEQQGLRYFVMQYVESGLTLDDLLVDQPMEPIAALRLMIPILSALAYAHARGVVHRDIKPANIMLPQPDWPMLADFGIAKMIDDSQQLTPPGQSVGTAIYMAPERASSTTVDVRTDLYSVGVVLYEMLTGQVPFDGVSPVDVLRKHIHEPVPRPRTINPGLPAVAEPVLLRALAKKPADRYQSADEMARDVQRLIGQIERLAAERQLQEMLGQPAAAPAPSSSPAARGPAGRGAGRRQPRADAYKTQEFTPYALPALESPAEPPWPASRRPWIPAVMLGLVLLLGLGGMALVRAANGRSGANAGANIATAVPATAVPAGAVALATVAPAPTAPALPTAAIVATAAPPAATIEPPAATLPPAPANPPPAPQPAPPVARTTPQVAQGGATTTIRFEDTDWLGGYRRPGGLTYGGRTATWVYGTTTEYNTMRVAFNLVAQPAGPASLTVEGMDSEGRAKTPIRIMVNGSEIYNDLNPLPDDDQPLETGTWASYTWQFDAALLRPGRNEISISNLAEGAFSRPPFFMLDYADLAFSDV
jgi:tRNA A-37 threonylcarbamoyl transferase component Bud32